MDISLALGGGGIRGIAHIGVIRCLESAGFRIRAVAGTSAGGLVGTVFAAGYTPAEIEQLLSGVDQRRLFGRKSHDGPSLMGMSGITNLLTQVLGERTFLDLKIPAAVTAVDTISGREVVLHHGNVVEATLATAAVPGVFPARPYRSAMLIDGGVLDPVPVLVARWLAPNLPVVAVVLNDPVAPFFDQEHLGLPIRIPAPAPIIEQIARLRYAQALNVFVRSVEIATIQLTEARLQTDRPEVTIRPDVSRFGLLDPAPVAELVRMGEEAATRVLPGLRKTVSLYHRMLRRLSRTISEPPSVSPDTIIVYPPE